MLRDRNKGLVILISLLLYMFGFYKTGIGCGGEGREEEERKGEGGRRKERRKGREGGGVGKKGEGGTREGKSGVEKLPNRQTQAGLGCKLRFDHFSSSFVGKTILG